MVSGGCLIVGEGMILQYVLAQLKGAACIAQEESLFINSPWRNGSGAQTRHDTIGILVPQLPSPAFSEDIIWYLGPMTVFFF